MQFVPPRCSFTTNSKPGQQLGGLEAPKHIATNRAMQNTQIRTQPVNILSIARACQSENATGTITKHTGPRHHMDLAQHRSSTCCAPMASMSSMSQELRWGVFDVTSNEAGVLLNAYQSQEIARYLRLWAVGTGGRSARGPGLQLRWPPQTDQVGYGPVRDR